MLKQIAYSALTLLSVSTYANTDLEGREHYAPDYFARYGPQNAEDMVSQVPGFTLANRDGNNSQRGLGQGLGNLLINGKRPSTKDDGPVALLERIPANQVLRIEVLNQGSAELSGQSGKIVNVIAAEPKALSTTWKYEYHAVEDGFDTPKFDISMTGKLGTAAFTAGIDWSGDQFPQWGRERLYTPLNTVYEFRDETSNYFTRATTANLSLAWDTDDLIANVSLLITQDKSTYEESSDRFSASIDGSIGAQTNAVDYKNIEDQFAYELGGDYTQALGNGQLKIIALLRRSSNDDHATFTDLPTIGDHYLYQSFSKPKESENILRTVYSFELFDGHNFEWATELVENTLETHSTYLEDKGAGFTPLVFDGSDTEVSEERAELSLQYSRALSERLSLQASLGSEYSQISVAGDENRSESFVRPKGFLALSWTQNQNLRIRTRLERSVGQLDFYDFASSNNANDGTALGGNTALVPEQTWRAELSFEQQLGLGNSVTLTAFGERIDDFITYMPMSGGGEGKGNLEYLDSTGIDLTATFNTESWGITGGKLDLTAEIHSDEFEDPLTGNTLEYRRDGYRPEYYQLSFRQDLPRTPWAWGLILEERSGNITYRRNSLRDQDHSGLQAHRIFIEHKDLWGMVAKFEVEDLFGFTYENDLTFFTGDRGGEVERRETNKRHSPWVARMSISGTF